MKLRLRFEGGPMMGREVEVAADTTLGRGEGNGIVLADPSVSSRHACIVFRDGVAWIEDTGSTNGIAVNGQETRAAPLRRGDRVELGDVRLVVVSDHAPLVAERAATPADGGRRVFHWPRRGVLARRIAAAALVLATLDYLTNVTGCRRQPGMVLPATLRATAQGFKRDGVKLMVRETAGLERIAEPVTSGLPLPEGAVRAADGLSLLDAAGQPIPCQVIPQALWRDGSLKRDFGVSPSQ